MKSAVIVLVVALVAFIAGWIFNRLVGGKVDAVVSDVENAAKKVKEDATK